MQIASPSFVYMDDDRLHAMQNEASREISSSSYWFFFENIDLRHWEKPVKDIVRA